MILAALVACTPAPLQLEARVIDGGIEVDASRPMARVSIAESSGLALGETSPASPAETATVLLPVRPGASYRVLGETEDGVVAVTELRVPSGCARVELEVPAGQSRWPASTGSWPVPHRDGGTPVGLRLTALEPCTPRVVVDGEPVTVELPTAGARESVIATVGDTAVTVRVDDLSLELVPDSSRDPAADLRVEGWTFPTDARGGYDPTRAADRIDLPPRWWTALLARSGLGIRARHDQAPWAWQTLELTNDADRPLHLVVEATIEEGGAPSPAFRARIRDHAVDGSRALVTVPSAGQTRVALPVYVDPTQLTGRRMVTRRVSLTPLGADSPLQTLTAPLTVSRGSSWATAGLLAALAVSVAGWIGVALGLRRLGRQRTSDLVTVALFASATWVVGAAFQVVGTTIGWLLGPFTPLVMGLPDQAFRACLLATLLTLIPRPGVLALGAGVGFLLRGLTFGALHPTDLLYLGSAIAFLEGGAWLSGLTRDDSWRDASRLTRWLRLTVGLAGANVAATAVGLVVTATLYRLYLAEWYVAALLLLPGTAYVAVGCALAVPFAESLREVRR